MAFLDAFLMDFGGANAKKTQEESKAKQETAQKEAQTKAVKDAEEARQKADPDAQVKVSNLERQERRDRLAKQYSQCLCP